MSGQQCTGIATTSKTAYIYLGSKQIAEVKDGVAQYVHDDALGSPVAHTDGNKTELNRTKYEPYGFTAGGTKPGVSTQGQVTTGSAIGFTGHVNDADTDLVYMQQRYYDPIAGRFLSVDPVVTDANTGTGFGLYTYVGNNPYSRVDPDGRAWALAGVAGEAALDALGAAAFYVGSVITAGYIMHEVYDQRNTQTAAAMSGNQRPGAAPAPPGSPGSDKGCIYLCDGVTPGQRTPSGNPYVGSADDKDARAQGARDGRERDGATVIGEYKKGDREARGNAEQTGMNDNGGKDKLDNKRNEVAEKKWPRRGIKPPKPTEEKK